MNRITGSSAVALAAALAAPVRGQQTAAPAFDGPRVEAVLGTDSDLFYGGAIGYDIRRGRTVFGVEGEIDLGSGRRCETLDPTINDRLCVHGRRDLAFAARIGIAVAPATLLYAKAGYTSLHERVTYDAPPSAGGGFRFVDRWEGGRVGAGVEQRIGPNLYLKGEYRYSNYDRGGWKHDGVVGIGVRF